MFLLMPLTVVVWCASSKKTSLLLTPTEILWIGIAVNKWLASAFYPSAAKPKSCSSF